ncbi:ig-like domain-containing protein [Trichonephila clavipes]|nr:ig-like domain-containing protein [Trichonephila clavipes]
MSSSSLVVIEVLQNVQPNSPIVYLHQGRNEGSDSLFIFGWCKKFVIGHRQGNYGGSCLLRSLPTYTFIEGDRAELPCDLNVSATEDEVSLVLWHRDESGSPLYSVDARDLPLPTATHFPAVHMESRSYFNSSASPAYLRIEGIKKDEEGIYRCRIEYRRARTETMDMMLLVIGE